MAGRCRSSALRLCLPAFCFKTIRSISHANIGLSLFPFSKLSAFKVCVPCSSVGAWGTEGAERFVQVRWVLLPCALQSCASLCDCVDTSQGKDLFWYHNECFITCVASLVSLPWCQTPAEGAAGRSQVMLGPDLLLPCSELLGCWRFCFEWELTIRVRAAV